MEDKILEWAVELQSIAQSGLYYCKDRFDVERFERIRELAAEMVQLKSGCSLEQVKEAFCSEAGYQTPKMDTRAAVFQDGKILLVQESSGKWALPGGWVDVDLSVGENAVKEVREEAGLTVTADAIIAVQDRDRHNRPEHVNKICKVFVLCTCRGGAFEPNPETIASGYFSADELPVLDEDKTTAEQVRMCFDAGRDPNWKTKFD